MPINNYGIWVAKPVKATAERAAQDAHSPHIHLFYDDGTGGNYDNSKRASINVKSISEISTLVFWLVQDFRHPITDKLRELDMGFNQVTSQGGGIALDYIRGNLVDFSKGRILPHDRPASNDDIIDFIMPELSAAINRGATIYLFGEPYSDMEGIHDIHMNQGSQGNFSRYNGVWQDGGIVIYFPDENRFSAIFLAFASQAVHTDEQTGNALSGSQNFAQLLGYSDDQSDVTISDELPVAIIAALVNPKGSEGDSNYKGKPELVYLLNRTDRGISLEGWSLINKNEDTHILSGDIWLAPGEICSITMSEVPLSNKGGLISLLDKDGNKVDGVTYTKKQAREDGKLILFR